LRLGPRSQATGPTRSAPNQLSNPGSASSEQIAYSSGVMSSGGRTSGVASSEVA
jgi:hypothetical protein